MKIRNRTGITIVFTLLAITIIATLFLQIRINNIHEFNFTGLDINIDEGFIIPVAILIDFLMNLNIIYGGFQSIQSIGKTALIEQNESATIPEGKMTVLIYMIVVWFIILIIAYILMMINDIPYTVLGIEKILYGFGSSVAIYGLGLNGHKLAAPFDLSGWTPASVKNEVEI